jgi:hypothetical protein
MVMGMTLASMEQKMIVSGCIGCRAATRRLILGRRSLFLMDHGWHCWKFTLTAGLHYVCYRRGRMFQVLHVWDIKIVGGGLMIYRKDSIS